MIDKRLVHKLQKALRRLTAKISILDAQGNCLAPEGGLGCDRLEELVEGEVVLLSGKSYLLTDTRPQMILCAEGDCRDLLLLASALAETICLAEGGRHNAQDVYRRILLEELSGSEMDALSHEQAIPGDMERCVMLFQIIQTGHTSAYALLSEIIPMADSDCLVEMDRHMVALIKDMAPVENPEELDQFAQAVSETLMSETAHQAIVGIGLPRHNLHALGESYREARRAMEVGRIFKPQETICQFRRLLLERFLTEVPREVSLYYHNLLFNRKTARLFNEEMLYTIEMFFKKDLNLSDTARQLYIHRNTLVYRLDKVQRQIGLDLRKFEDAVTFKILLELKKCGSEKPVAIH
ncbi:MAG: helix-turn-helix domain-containing protein [Clostridia bacterium]|nr:helix-turn-helix domain-containing protein [Clostridia bacterium]